MVTSKQLSVDFFFQVSPTINQKNRDDGLILLRNLNGQQMDKKRKTIIKIFKDIGFSIDIQTNLTEEDFLDVTLNL